MIRDFIYYQLENNWMKIKKVGTAISRYGSPLVLNYKQEHQIENCCRAH